MRLGLVLAGGGSRGAFEAGVLAAVEDAGIEPTILSGTSAGALNAAGVAAGFSAARLAELWMSITDRDVYRHRRDVWRLLRPRGLLRGNNIAGRLLSSIGWTWIWDPTPLRRTLVGALGGEQLTIRDGVTVALSAVDAATGGLVRFTNRLPDEPGRRGTYEQVDLGVDHLMASAALPLLFKPAQVASRGRKVRRDRGARDRAPRLFWDGGILANTPLAPALAYAPDAVIVVKTATLERPAPQPRTLAEAISLVIDATQRFSLASDLARAETLNELARVAPGATDRRVVDLLVIDARGLDLGQGLRFEPEQARRGIALGHQVGTEAIAGWRAEGRL